MLCCVFLEFALPGFMLSIFNGIKAWRYQLQSSKSAKVSDKELVFLRCIPDFLFHFISCFAGVFALVQTFYFSESIRNFEQISFGAAFVLVSGFVFGILGTSGQLPRMFAAFRNCCCGK